MVGNPTPDWAMMHVGATDAKATYVNAVESEEWQHGGKAARRHAFQELEHFMHVERMRKLMCGLVAPVPVVEIARDDKRGVRRNEAFDALTQAFELAASSSGCQREMYANAVQRRIPSGHLKLAVE